MSGNNFFQNLSPKNKRIVVIASTVLVVGTIIGVAMNNANPDRAERTSSRPAVTAVITDEDPRALGMDAVSSQIRQLQAAQTRLERTLGQREQERTSRQDQEMISSLQEELRQLQMMMADMQANAAAPTTPATPVSDDVAPSDSAGLIPERTPSVPVQATDSPDALSNVYNNLPEPPPVDPTTRSSQPVEAPRIRSIRKAEPEVDPNASDEVVITLPSGSILSGVLMTGMDAPTGNQAQRDPFPTLLRIKEEAILPNRFRADFRECFLIAAGWGDLSSERAYMRAERISCVRNDGTVLESTLDAYATGEDGKTGLRGRLVSKQGQVIARSLMAGFMQGVAGAFDVRQVPSINITRGDQGKANSPVYEQAFNSNTAQAAGAGGVSTAMERIADYYLSMAENIFPIIEIDAMREVDFIVKRGMTVTMTSAESLTQVNLN